MKLSHIVSFTAASALAALAIPASAAVITFNNLQPDPGQLYGTFSTYTEDGYTATNRGGFSGSFFNGYLADTSQTPEISGSIGTVSITGSGLFSLTSFDAFLANQNNPTSSYTVTGYLAGASIYTSSGSIARGPATLSSGSPLTTYSGFSSTLFDRVDIAISGPAPTYVDNITVSPAVGGAVPEPTTWAMMIAGFGLVGGTMRRPRRATVRFA